MADDTETEDTETEDTEERRRANTSSLTPAQGTDGYTVRQDFQFGRAGVQSINSPGCDRNHGSGRCLFGWLGGRCLFEFGKHF